MEIIIGNVLLRAFLRGTQNVSCEVKLKVNKPECVAGNNNNRSSREQRHNLPGTPDERLSLQTTVIFMFSVQIVKM